MPVDPFGLASCMVAAVMQEDCPPVSGAGAWLLTTARSWMYTLFTPAAMEMTAVVLSRWTMQVAPVPKISRLLFTVTMAGSTIVPARTWMRSPAVAATMACESVAYVPPVPAVSSAPPEKLGGEGAVGAAMQLSWVNLATTGALAPACVGAAVGLGVGELVGGDVGVIVGLAVGAVGRWVGRWVGLSVALWCCVRECGVWYRENLRCAD